ncbi:hypothetical protein BS636_08685 [Acinetobacter sp. LoGeW2-3]|uniref:hypothetical protein n=1 Tax=Acinetobacter sp. LoGeW2-3 TaxID=1808001 RepID=UPI000C05930E|nr:hypothetical protein [Acinetobacter sp. LoGeW2-3]ATO21038.1 hypothetical protein BS636_08685 [Acinetobacter sp. LoGeW2-3]
MIYEDDYDDDRPVKRISANKAQQTQFGSKILKQAQQYLEDISAQEHAFLIKTLEQLANEEAYFQTLSNELNQPVGAKVANDALNLLHFWQAIHQFEDVKSFNLLDVINGEDFQRDLLSAFDQLEINDQEERRKVLLESLKLYKLGFYTGCIPMLYAQLEGLLTEVLLKHGFLKQQGNKFVDVHKIVPGLKGSEIKSLWHKSKIACELNPYFAELAAYKMDTSSTVTMTRHNILHGTDVSHFHQGRSFVLFIWLFSAIGFISTLRA